MTAKELKKYYGLGYLICRDLDRAKDAVHNAIVRWLPKKDTIENTNAYLCQAIRNELRHTTTKGYKIYANQEQYDNEMYSYCDNILEHAIVNHDIPILVRGLCKAEKERFLLFLEDDVRGVSEQLGITYAMAKTSIVNARIKLREAYERHS